MYSKKTTIVLSILYSMAILLTILLFWSLTNTATEDDIFGNALNLQFSLLFLLPIFLAETELFYNLLYFVNARNKKIYQTVCNLLSLALSTSTAFLLLLINKTIFLKAVETGILVSFGAYLSVRAVYFILRLRSNGTGGLKRTA